MGNAAGKQIWSFAFRFPARGNHFTVFFAAMLPRFWMMPASKSILSARVVLPEPACPQQGDIFYMVGIVNCHNGELKVDRMSH
jgi:hypothetical protein